MAHTVAPSGDEAVLVGDAFEAPPPLAPVCHEAYCYEMGVLLRFKIFSVLAVVSAAVVGPMVACGSDSASGAGDAGASDATLADAPVDRGSQEDGSPESGPGDAALADGSDSGSDADAFAGDGGIVCTGEAGTLDPSFGDGGMVWLKYSGAQAFSVAVQVDGKILVGGATQAGFALVRLLPDGSGDPSFGTNGLITTLVGESIPAGYTALAIQPADGKIVAVGATGLLTGTRSLDFGVVRYFPGGGLDPTFGDGGAVATDFGSTDDYPQSVGLLADGRILVGGQNEINAVASTGNYVLARYQVDGTLDTTFGTGGKVTIDVHGTEDTPGVVALVPGGKIVIAGTSARTTSLSSTAFDISAVQLNADGTLDTSFADAGKLVTNFGPDRQQAYAINVDRSGRVILGGRYIGAAPQGFVVVRLTASGALDPTFGDGGVVTTAFRAGADDVASSVLVQDDGKLLATGISTVGSSTTNIALTRYLPNGMLDLGFGTEGRSLTPPPPNADLAAAGAAMSGCTFITVATWGYDNGTVPKNAMGIARYRR